MLFAKPWDPFASRCFACGAFARSFASFRLLLRARVSDLGRFIRNGGLFNRLAFANVAPALTRMALRTLLYHFSKNCVGQTKYSGRAQKKRGKRVRKKPPKTDGGKKSRKFRRKIENLERLM